MLDKIQLAATAAAFVDAGFVKLASDADFEVLVEHSAAFDAKTPEEKLAGLLLSLPEDDEKRASAGVLGITLRKRNLLEQLLEKIKESEAQAHLPGVALGLGVGGYLGHATKERNDLLGLPYNYEYEF